jgi:hypothetical protein
MQLRARPIAYVCAVVLACASGGLLAQSSGSAEGRKPWAEVAAPVIVSVNPFAGDPSTVAVAFALVTGTDGADRASVEMMDSNGAVIDSKLLGKSKNDLKTAVFSPPRSGNYSFRVTALRGTGAESKSSETIGYEFILPLAAPAVSARNVGGGGISVSWNAVAEAEAYEVSLKGKEGAAVRTRETRTILRGLSIGSSCEIAVWALRGKESGPPGSLRKLVKAEAEREWFFTWFGQSTRAELNAMEMLDADNLRFKLSSCTVLKDGQIDLKGGKFTAFHDGISFYYTVIEADKENFELTATFTVDYINPTADGQEGFGLIAMDSLGGQGVSAKNHYTNSAGVIATKFEATIGGVKRTSKDTLGARFVSGIDSGVLSLGDAGIASRGSSIQQAFSYDSGSLVRSGDTYTLSLKKTNTGYHAANLNPYAPPETPTEFIMYGPEKLQALDADHVYVGFAVARGCNVTVKDVKMTISEPSKDPPAVPEPAPLLPLEAKADCPPTYGLEKYPFVFTANADGVLRVVDEGGAVLVRDAVVRKGKDFEATFKLAPGFNNYALTFTLDPKYTAPGGAKLAVFDGEAKEYVPITWPLRLAHSVLRHSYSAPELRVSPDGNFMGKGTPEDPMDLATALAFSLPGQPIVLAGGTYNQTRPFIIERGNDGTAAKPKVLKSASSGRPILDFSSSTGGMQIWGDWWVIEGIDVRNTRGNVKGVQVAGSDNVLSDIRVYNCGDTGIQISGSSAEPFEKWPARNSIRLSASWGNADPAWNNADGFAAKLACGEGNSFFGCMAYSNIDDGWDLYTKIDSGPIGAVIIDSCVAFRNGSLPDGTGRGDGNGFKLGGDGIAVAHVLKNSAAWDNGSWGITSNSNPAVVLERNTAYGNKEGNVSLYGKAAGPRMFRVTGVLSMKGGSADQFGEMPALASPNNYFWDGARCVNSEGRVLSTDIFIRTELKSVPELRPGGGFDMAGFLALSSKAPAGAGAALR